jgi:hypothetical protein
MCAEETLRSVVIGIFSDFLDGDLEMVRTLLRKFFSRLCHSGCQVDDIPLWLGGINDLSPSLRLGDEGIDTILLTLQGLRDRVLSMFTLPSLSALMCLSFTTAVSLPRPHLYRHVDAFSLA